MSASGFDDYLQMACDSAATLAAQTQAATLVAACISNPVDRGGIEPPTHGFSVQQEPSDDVEYRLNAEES